MNCDSALSLTNSFYGLDCALKDKHLVSFYDRNPCLSRCAMVPLGVISGSAKVILFPLISAIGAIVMPIMALVRAIQAHKESPSPRKEALKKEAVVWLKGGGLCLLGLGGTFAFIFITGFHVPLVWSATAFGGFFVISISIHVYKMAKSPSLEQQEAKLY